MRLEKTDKARAELQPGSRTLSLRERSLLLLANGRKTAQEIGAYYGEEGQRLVQQLLHDGYLAPAAPEAPTQTTADPFEGRRSLATTRMFLFDICERMFARRAPALADMYRTALRNARDRASMLAVSHEMLDEIARAGGADRATGIRERMALLLPEELAA